MKKVLILAYDFPPYVSVGGLRPYNWFKYFREFGIDPVVVTRQWENKYGNGLDYVVASPHPDTQVETSSQGVILRTPYTQTWSNRMLEQRGEDYFPLLRKVNTAMHEFKQFVTVSGPKKAIYEEARKYLQHHRVDAILATGDPFVLFFYAKKLSQEFGIPWVADYRDPWSQNVSVRSMVFRSFLTHIEQRVTRSAAAIVTVSDYLRHMIQKRTGYTSNMYVISNGFDEEVMNDLPNQDTSQSVQIALAGTIYPWHPWKSLLKILNDHPAAFKFTFIGVNNEDEIRSFITLENLTNIQLSFLPRMSNREAVHELAKNNLLMLFNDYSIMGTKIFDYLGTRRKIILCYGNDLAAMELKKKHYTMEEIDGVSKHLQADLIEETQAGIVVQDEQDLPRVLQELADEFAANGRIACESVGVEQYSRKIQVKQLAELIKTL